MEQQITFHVHVRKGRISGNDHHYLFDDAGMVTNEWEGDDDA